MIAILLAEGFEEIEALTPRDVLMRAGFDTRCVSITGERAVVGAHGITVLADATAGEIAPDDIEMLILPGGMPGTMGLDGSAVTDRFIEAALRRGVRIGAICAAPLILGRRGLLVGKRAVCYPGFEGELDGAVIAAEAVVTDGLITTAKGMGAALPFSLELVRLMKGETAASELAVQVIYTPKEN